MHDFRAMNKYIGNRALKYDEKRENKSATQRDQAIVESFLSNVPDRSSVLDLPAGTGRFIEFCVGRGLLYTGIDISKDMLEVARTKIPLDSSNVELTVADARALPFPDDSFDYAIVIKFVKWLPTVEILADALREIGRVTRKEMLVQITVELAIQSRMAKLVRRARGLPIIGPAIRRLKGRGNEVSHAGGSRAFSEQDMADAFSSAGLIVRSVAPDRPSKKQKKGYGPSTVRNFYVLSKENRVP